jgi:hypothetical protein
MRVAITASVIWRVNPHSSERYIPPFGAIVYRVLCALCVRAVPCAMYRRHLTHTLRHTHTHGTYIAHVHGAQIHSTQHKNTNTVQAHSHTYNTLHTWLCAVCVLYAVCCVLCVVDCAYSMYGKIGKINVWQL